MTWRSLGNSNPCFRRERATSWAARRGTLKVWRYPPISHASSLAGVDGHRCTGHRGAATTTSGTPALDRLLHEAGRLGLLDEAARPFVDGGWGSLAAATATGTLK